MNSGVHHFADFGNRALVAPLTVSTQYMAPTVTLFGLPMVSAYIWGTVFDEIGTPWTIARDLPPHVTSGLMLLSNNECDFMRLQPASFEAWRGGTLFEEIANCARWTSTDVALVPEPALRFVHHGSRIEYRERGVLNLAGATCGTAYQWYEPTDQQGAVCQMHFVEGQVGGRPVKGWIGLDHHFQKPGLNHFSSPMVAGGLSLTWISICNYFEDGSWEVGAITKGLRDWGLAIMADSSGGLSLSTKVDAEFESNEQGYPTRMLFKYRDDKTDARVEWLWSPALRGEMREIQNMLPQLRHARPCEGHCVRVGEPRQLRYATAWPDFFADGRLQQWQAAQTEGRR